MSKSTAEPQPIKELRDRIVALEGAITSLEHRLEVLIEDVWDRVTEAR